MRRKLKDTGGLTMVELLCATAILVLLCLMMNTCLAMAVNSYRAITAESEARLLVSSLSDALADKLRYCVVTEKTKTETVGGVETVTVEGRCIFISEINEENKINLTSGAVAEEAVKADPADGQIKVDGKPLLPGGAYGKSGSYIGRYTVEKVPKKDGDGNPGVDGAENIECEPLVAYVPPPAADGTPSFRVKFIVKDEQLGITREADFTVRCLNPVKKEGDSP